MCQQENENFTQQNIAYIRKKPPVLTHGRTSATSVLPEMMATDASRDMHIQKGKAHNAVIESVLSLMAPVTQHKALFIWPGVPIVLFRLLLNIPLCGHMAICLFSF